MGARGPAPKNPEDRIRRNADPIADANGWIELERTPNENDVPPIPVWVECSEQARMIYEEITKLPQARLWGPGTYFEIHLALPLLDKYLEKPGSDGFKTIVSAWGAGLRLTEDDLQRARIRFKKEIDPDELEDAKKDPKVIDMKNRRDRLLGKQNANRGLAEGA
ncbi:hypothetical protein CJ179_38405 [Rhodococcus sp. ACS1]|uniref:phage terminase small subunit n=1 Tax=Rhodococcus sp. ACS1 TaxID=2028570 RepID=UPI000BDC3848|nr:hypothetical protein [Rhodococcus sp. ACS1]PBC38481.1 hypothetical protein CJ179_38405 [Rhodococcus sp. ACS1]